MRTSASFIEQYESNVTDLHTGTAHDLPAAVVAYPEGNGHRAERLTLSGLHLVEADGEHIPFFDILMGADESPLSEHAAIATTFAQSETWEAYIGKQNALVTVDPYALTERPELLTLAHELGHTYDTPLVVGALGLSVGNKIPLSTERALEAFAPAVNSLIRYARKTPKFKDEVRNLLNTDIEPVTKPVDLMGQHNLDVYFMSDSAHLEAAIAVSALREAAAWSRAFQLVASDALDPGMSTDEMHQAARSSVQTYEKLWGSTLHINTLVEANHR